jgi:outer membrane protein
MRLAARAVVVAAALSAAGARAELRPEWELGAGASAITLSDYRGSDESHTYVLPFPYLIYRGERLRVDRQGLRGILFDSGRVHLDISAHATPPVDSDENRARQGMPSLDPTLEIGPRLNIDLVRDRARERTLTLRLPVRAVVATDLSHTRGAGYTAYPHLDLDLRPVFLGGKWNLGLQAGPLYGSREHHEYFYGVAPQFATAERPAYQARGGYSGAVALVSLTRRFPRFWLGAFARYDTLKGAVFEASPLVRRDHAVMAGFAIAWVFAQSETLVEAESDE